MDTLGNIFESVFCEEVERSLKCFYNIDVFLQEFKSKEENKSIIFGFSILVSNLVCLTFGNLNGSMSNLNSAILISRE
jgi:hypothetical protein